MNTELLLKIKEQILQLGLPYSLVIPLCYVSEWPDDLRMEYNEATTRTEKAAVAARVIENGGEL